MTLDLPTPPLPDEMSSGRVFEPFWANGMLAPLGVAVGLAAWPAVAPASPCRRLAQVLALAVGHHGELEVDRVDAVELRSPRRTRAGWISFFSGQPGTVSAMSTPTTPLPRMSTLRTMPRSTIERCSSGSWTGRSASMTCASVTGWPFVHCGDEVAIAPNLHYAHRDNSARIQFGDGVEPVVHRNRVGDHRRVR